MNSFRKIIFWYAVTISFGLLFVMARFDGIRPGELIRYVHEPTLSTGGKEK